MNKIWGRMPTGQMLVQMRRGGAVVFYLSCLISKKEEESYPACLVWSCDMTSLFIQRVETVQLRGAIELNKRRLVMGGTSFRKVFMKPGLYSVPAHIENGIATIDLEAAGFIGTKKVSDINGSDIYGTPSNQPIHKIKKNKT